MDQMGKNMSQEVKSKGWRNGSMDFDGLYDAYMVVAWWFHPSGAV